MKPAYLHISELPTLPKAQSAKPLICWFYRMGRHKRNGINSEARLFLQNKIKTEQDCVGKKNRGKSFVFPDTISDLFFLTHNMKN